MRLRPHLVIGALAVLALATPALGDALHLAPKMPMSLDVAPLPRTFFMHSIDFDHDGGRVILAANPDGTGNLHTNDEFQMVVLHADGTASWYRHDYAGDPTKAPGETPPVDITSLFRPGPNRIEIRMLDLYGARFGANDYYVVNLAEGEPRPKTVVAKSYQPERDAFIYAETPVFVKQSPGPIELCIVSPRGGERAIARLRLSGLGTDQPEPLALTLNAGFNRTPIPLGELREGTYSITGTVQIADGTLDIPPHPLARIAPPFSAADIAEIVTELGRRIQSDKARIAAGEGVRAAAADALVSRAVMERVQRRSPASLAADEAPDANDIVARAKLLLSCSRLVETDAMGRTTIDRLGVLQGQYLDWGRLRFAKMAAAPGRVRYERGAVRLEGTYHNLTIYWANLPIASVRRSLPRQSRRLDAVSAWPEVEWGRATPITVAGRPAALFPLRNGFASVVVRTSRFTIETYAATDKAAIWLAELSLAEQPITAEVADSLFSNLEPPVAVSGVRELMRVIAQPDELASALKRSASHLARGRFQDAAEALRAAGAGRAEVLASDERHTLYALTTKAPPEQPPSLPKSVPVLACWTEGPDRLYLLVKYDGRAARQEAAATLVAMLDMLPGRQMLVGDLHQHSNVSDGMGDPEEMFFQTLSHFTDFHALTDHNAVRGAEAVAERLPSWGMDYPFFVGEEVTREFAHIVAIDPDGLVDWKGEPVEVLKRIHDSGAVAILAHPWTTPFQEIYRKNPLAEPKIDAYQYNSTWYAQWRRKGTIPPMVEVTDTHSMSFVWPYRAVVFAQEATCSSVKRALLEGKCCAWTPAGPRGPDRVRRVVWALISDREYYEEQQLERLAKRVAGVR